MVHCTTQINQIKKMIIQCFKYNIRLPNKKGVRNFYIKKKSLKHYFAYLILSCYLRSVSNKQYRNKLKIKIKN